MKPDEYYEALIAKSTGEYQDIEESAKIDRCFRVDTGAAAKLDRLSRALSPEEAARDDAIDRAFGLR